MQKKNWAFHLHDMVLALLGTVFALSAESGLSIAFAGVEPFQLGFGGWTYFGMVLVTFGLMKALVRFGYRPWRDYRED